MYVDCHLLDYTTGALQASQLILSRKRRSIALDHDVSTANLFFGHIIKNELWGFLHHFIGRQWDANVRLPGQKATVPKMNSWLLSGIRNHEYDYSSFFYLRN